MLRHHLCQTGSAVTRRTTPAIYPWVDRNHSARDTIRLLSDCRLSFHSQHVPCVRAEPQDALCRGGWAQPSSLQLSPWVLDWGRAAEDSLRCPCRASQPPALGRRLSRALSPPQHLPEGCHDSKLWRGPMDQEAAAASPTGADGEEGHHKRKPTHFPFLQAFLLEKLKQSTSEAITASLEASQCKISQLMALDTPARGPLPPSQICQQNLSAHVHLCCSSLFAPCCSSFPFSLHCRQTHGHQKVDSFLHSGTCTSPSICLLPHLDGEDFSSNIHWEVWEVATPKGSTKSCPAFHSAPLLL